MVIDHDVPLDFGAIQYNNTSSYDDNNQRYLKHRHKGIELHSIETTKSQQCLRKTAKFLFSHIALVGLVAVCAVTGGFIFQLFEEREEQLMCQKAQGQQIAEINKLKQQFVNYIQQNTTLSINWLSEGKDNATVALEKIGSMLYGYRDFVIQAASQQLFFRDDCLITVDWTYPNALLFAITILTTIGYGNITPLTWEGQLCCISYGTVSIPIFLLCLANISGVLGEMFRFLYDRVLCAPYDMLRKRCLLANKTKDEEENGVGTGRVDSDDNVLDDENKKSSLKQPSNTSADHDEFDEHHKGEKRRVAVPLTVTMIIIAVYIYMGSGLFHAFEGWTMMQSGYFCFITLSTIGFGDFAPGQITNESNVGEKLVIGTIYALFGMAILAMCFDLMQEEIVAKVHWIGRKLGIIESKDENKNSMENVVTSQSKSFSAGKLSVSDTNVIMNTTRTIVENENEYGKPTQRNPIATHKSSSRNNSARVHPMAPS
ncbi:unnamed protein product [Rotaria magnacalcarata]|uniref:Potassium channel domain-containing protein n=9 Tax=Rotaria magnacalcarata TaxID=392030 RepID=A0A816Q6J2_9BILA|nr:unnamed protein product [Rotaria magnacalcarata]CAF2086679.1 unnamed protein product [Rotaria magnacalcarata]CAF4280236.1 unnamed protein product [Rotaria magnacalcarata]